MSHQETKRDVLTVAPMGMFLVIPDGDVLTSAIVVDGGTTLRTASLRNTAASGTSRSQGVQPVRADLGGHLKYSRRWSGVRAGVLLGVQGAVRRGENRGGL